MQLGDAILRICLDKEDPVVKRLCYLISINVPESDDRWKMVLNEITRDPNKRLPGFKENKKIKEYSTNNKEYCIQNLFLQITP